MTKKSMHNSQRYTILIKISLLCIITTTSCSFVSLDTQARDVNVSENISALKDCKFLGETNVSLWSKAETFQSQTTVENQLDTLARNNAATMGGNTITPKSEINNGQRTYSVYNCISHI